MNAPNDTPQTATAQQFQATPQPATVNGVPTPKQTDKPVAPISAQAIKTAANKAFADIDTSGMTAKQRREVYNQRQSAMKLERISAKDAQIKAVEKATATANDKAIVTIAKLLSEAVALMPKDKAAEYEAVPTENRPAFVCGYLRGVDTFHAVRIRRVLVGFIAEQRKQIAVVNAEQKARRETVKLATSVKNVRDNEQQTRFDARMVKKIEAGEALNERELSGISAAVFNKLAEAKPAAVTA